MTDLIVRVPSPTIGRAPDTPMGADRHLARPLTPHEQWWGTPAPLTPMQQAQLLFDETVPAAEKLLWSHAQMEREHQARLVAELAAKEAAGKREQAAKDAERRRMLADAGFAVQDADSGALLDVPEDEEEEDRTEAEEEVAKGRHCRCCRRLYRRVCCCFSRPAAVKPEPVGAGMLKFKMAARVAVMWGVPGTLIAVTMQSTQPQ